MKYSGANPAMPVSANSDSEVESLLLTSCWAQSAQADFMDSHKLMLDSQLMDGSMNGEDNDMAATKATMDALDSLLLNSQPIQSNQLAELKPLPPFVGYTGHLSINGIQGHHYHAIATQRIPEENNNNTSYTRPNYSGGGEQNIVSSSTCANADSATDAITGKPLFVNADDVIGVKLENYGDPDSSATKIYDNQTSVTDSGVTHVKTEIGEYDISSIDDIAAIIGSAIADTTVPNNNIECGEDPSASRDNWMELDAWIDGACGGENQQKSLIITQDGLSEFVLPGSPPSQQNQQGSTLQSLLTHGYMPLLQNRLQNGPPVKQEAPSSTSYGLEIISTSSPPANVVSTTDNIMLNGRYLQPGHYTVMSISDDRIRSPELMGQNYPHTTTTTPSAPKKSRSRAQKKQQQQASSTVFQSEQNLGLLGKEKPVHRCNICNRGFLNKSNIKVHLRTHTGEKPFRCETCAKAFRQKAHLIKHQQIHKRIGRD